MSFELLARIWRRGARWRSALGAFVLVGCSNLGSTPNPTPVPSDGVRDLSHPGDVLDLSHSDGGGADAHDSLAESSDGGPCVDATTCQEGTDVCVADGLWRCERDQRGCLQLVALECEYPNYCDDLDGYAACVVVDPPCVVNEPCRESDVDGYACDAITGDVVHCDRETEAQCDSIRTVTVCEPPMTCVVAADGTASCS